MKDVVRRGYDVLSRVYEDAYPTDTKYRPWLADLAVRLAPDSRIVDLGCGIGLPVAAAFAGHRVTGVDFSEVQIRRARELVPTAEFVCADVVDIDFPAGSVDTVLSFYMFIHLPLDEQPPLLAKIARWLRPGGFFLATMGHGAWTGTDENWLGGGAPHVVEPRGRRHQPFVADGGGFPDRTRGVRPGGRRRGGAVPG